MLRPWRGGAGRLRGLRPVNTEHVIVFQGWRATSGRVRRAISLRNAPTGNPAHPHQTHGGNVAGIFGRGRRPRRPAPGAGTAATRAARPHDAARFHFGTGPHRRARVPAPRHEAPRRRKMRFHCVINLKTRRAARRDTFDTCGPPRDCLGDPGAARSRHVPCSCPSRACQDLIPRAKRGRWATRPTPRKIGIRVERGRTYRFF